MFNTEDVKDKMPPTEAQLEELNKILDEMFKPLDTTRTDNK